MITTSFIEDLRYFYNLLNEKIPFSISRFGDGEMMVMEGQSLNLLHKKEFNFQGEEHLKNDLIRSFQHNQENYFVGVACPCCVGQEKSTWMKENTYLPDKCLTWANIFVNSNFSFFKKKIIPLFKIYNVTLVAQGNPKNLQFNVKNFYPIGSNAWVNNTDVYEKLRQQIIENKTQNELFIFCAGPYANILCSKLFNEFPNNTFIDIGSVFNVELGIGANRGYLQGANTLNKICIWN